MFLQKKYGLAQGDQLNMETGDIVRAKQEPIELNGRTDKPSPRRIR